MLAHSMHPTGRFQRREKRRFFTANDAVIRLPAETRDLVRLAERHMRLTCTIQHRRVWLATDDQSVEMGLETLK